MWSVSVVLGGPFVLRCAVFWDWLALWGFPGVDRRIAVGGFSSFVLEEVLLGAISYRSKKVPHRLFLASSCSAGDGRYRGVEIAHRSGRA